MSGTRSQGTNPRSVGESPRQRGTNPRTSDDHQLARIEAKLDQIIATLTQRQTHEGVRTLPDGQVFMPGTGILGQRPLSPEAQAALDALDQAHPDT